MSSNQFTVTAQEAEFSELVKVLFFLITLLDVWDTFCTTIINFAPIGDLTKVNVASILLTKEVNHKNIKNSCNGNALNVRGRSTNKGKSQEKARSKTRSCCSVINVTRRNI